MCVRFESEILPFSIRCSLPQIVKTFNAPNDLCTAVSEQVEAWQVLGLTYFTRVSADELQLLEKTLLQLKEEKYDRRLL